MIWEIPEKEILYQLENSNYSFLDAIDFTQQANIDEIRKIKPGAQYYFYQIFKEKKQNSLAIAALYDCWKSDEPFWQKRSGQTIIENALVQKNFEEALSVANEFITKFGNYEGIDKIKTSYIQALYGLEKDKEVISLLKSFFPGKELRTIDPELVLCKVVSTIRLGETGWKPDLLKLFLQEKASSIHVRLYRFIDYRSNWDMFDVTEQNLITGKYNLSIGKRTEAIAAIEQALSKIDVQLLIDNSLIKELGFAYQYGKQSQRGADFLAALAPKLDNTNKWIALEMAGRLNQEFSRDVTAKAQLKEVFLNTKDLAQADRALWFYMDISLTSSNNQFLEDVASYSSRWQDPEYFADLMDKSISQIVSAKDWKYLGKLYELIKTRGPASLLSRISYIINRLVSLGYITHETLATVIPVKELLSFIQVKVPDYYSFVGGFFFKQPYELTKVNNDKAKLSDEEKRKSNSFDMIAAGFIEYGLTDSAISFIESNFYSLSPATIIDISKKLVLRKNYNKAIIFLSRLAANGYPLTPQDLTSLYPVVYEPILKALSEKEGFPDILLYSLAFVESAFNPIIESDAGAVGLTQLLPETAAEMARLLKIDNFDLHDPEMNLKLGARFLSRLIQRTESVTKAFIAYNAGQTRVKRWDLQFTDLPLDLYIEAIPFSETRSYLKKVIKTAVLYGFYSLNKSIDQVLTLFFPGEKKSSSP